MMKIYEVWVDNSGTLRSDGYKVKSFLTRNKARAFIKELKDTAYRNYYAEIWIKESYVE